MTIDTNSQYITIMRSCDQEYHIFDLNKVAVLNNIELERLPYSLRVLLENLICHGQDNSFAVFSEWISQSGKTESEMDYYPSRVLMQDFTGVPAIVDLAALRDAIKESGGDPAKVNPMIPVDLVIDHSVQVDYYGKESALKSNTEIEINRNRERYEFLKWGQGSFNNFTVVPPGTGICHQVNIEYLAKVVRTSEIESKIYAFCDTVVGTDSHTTMVNGLSVLGWGVGGIEAESAMLGYALSISVPEVVGVRLMGEPQVQVNATDIVLHITNILRTKGVVGKFVEFFGEGLKSLSLADRATIANMAPEYGATCGFFPLDEESLRYLALTGRNKDHIEFVKQYALHQKLWHDHRNIKEVQYTDIIELDLSKINTTLSGPKRPQDNISLRELASNFHDIFMGDNKVISKSDDNGLQDGSIVIAAITSCTNTSNPAAMITAGLVAKKACELGLEIKPWVKTSLAPGSQVVSEYLGNSGLQKYLDQMGFNIVGYGCTTCIGNSGPLPDWVEHEIKDKNLIVASILSGNRNFEGRIHNLVKANYLASPGLVIAYAIAGSVNIDIEQDKLISKDGGSYSLQDLWPRKEEIELYLQHYLSSEIFAKKYDNLFAGNELWQKISSSQGVNYQWDENSTYIKRPPYFDRFQLSRDNDGDILKARILAIFGDSITTDHISPAGSIKQDSPAGTYLMERSVIPEYFNSYGSRRGNHEVMMRGTFANNRIKNMICFPKEGGYTVNMIKKQEMTIYDAAMQYLQHDVPLVIFAGKEYGTGSSRDWAAKGTKLLGVRAVIAESFERIHRSNLIGMGVFPMILPLGMSRESLDLTGEEMVSIIGLRSWVNDQSSKIYALISKDGLEKKIPLECCVKTTQEIAYLQQGGILQSVFNRFMNRKMIEKLQ